MNSNDHPIQSFIVKLWLEEVEAEGGVTKWQGYITHVPSGQRRYVRALDDIVLFMMDHLEAGGVEFDIGWRLRKALLRRRLPAQPSG